MGKIIGQVGKTIGKFLGVETSAPVAELPPVPPPPPITPRTIVPSTVVPGKTVRSETKRKIIARRKKGGTVKTSARGVTTGEAVSYKSLLSGSRPEE